MYVSYACNKIGNWKYNEWLKLHTCVKYVVYAVWFRFIFRTSRLTQNRRKTELWIITRVKSISSVWMFYHLVSLERLKQTWNEKISNQKQNTSKERPRETRWISYIYFNEFSITTITYKGTRFGKKILKILKKNRQFSRKNWHFIITRSSKFLVWGRTKRKSHAYLNWRDKDKMRHTVYLFLFF